MVLGVGFGLEAVIIAWTGRQVSRQARKPSMHRTEFGRRTRLHGRVGVVDEAVLSLGKTDIEFEGRGAIPGIDGAISDNGRVGSGVRVGSLLRDSPFGLHARFGERVDGRVWFHLVALAAMTDVGDPVIVGGKGPGRGNYGLVQADSYRNYAGLVTGPSAEDDFADVAVRAAIGVTPPRHLVEVGSTLVVRFNPREVAEWVEHVTKNALSFGDCVDDVAREYAQRIAPFTTLTDQDLAELDAFPDDGLDAAHG